MQILHYHIATVSTVGLIGSFYIYYLYKEKFKKRINLAQEWVHIGHLKQMYAYPIKSCAPILLNQAECSPMGLRNGWIRDRVLMVVDAGNNTFVTAKVYPELLKVKTSLKRALLKLEHPDMETIEVNLAEVVVTQQPYQIAIWNTPMPIYDCGQQVNEWFTKCLNVKEKKFRLIYYGSERNESRVGMRQMFNKCIKPRPGEVVYNIINEASVDELNTRLKSIKVSEANFRPMFLLSGAKPYDEENWKYVKVGENIFEIIKPSTRCISTAIDPETGMHITNMEPANLLKR
ncbi:unnamed protein product [Arctia plantaginis]|uniref:MOSC domain-containing protein n=1 Tax=Arctia plantaginis TaxID=874455 RepID=A0A8S1AHC0_ARCPL|nr:unnamed protein product [Arctia plantaginis]